MLERNEEKRNKVRQRRIERIERRHSRRFLINCFICYHLCALAIWNLPYTSDGITGKMAPFFRLYMTTTGIMQSWLMFSPNPDASDIYFEAQITYADGTVRSWDFPRMVKLGYTTRYRAERYRKLVENANVESNKILWPSLARFAARQNMTDPKNPPVSVELVRHYRQVPDPGMPWGTYNETSFYGGRITPEDLR